MGSFEFNISDEFQKQVDKLANFEEYAPKIVDAAAPIYLKHIKKCLRQSIRHKDTSTGELVEAAVMKKAKIAKNGVCIANLSFNGNDSKGVRNYLKAIEIEFGNSNQQACPFVDRAGQEAENDVAEAMQEAFNKEVGQGE